MPVGELRRKQETEAVNDRQEHALNAVLDRASLDWEFRQRLLSEPLRALKDTFNLVIPASFRIRFVERDAGLDALIVLPDFTGGTRDDDELAEDDLEVVNGGGGHPTPWSRYR
jgi:hypothetical protein